MKNKIVKYHCDKTMAKILENMNQKVDVVDSLNDEDVGILIRYGNTQPFNRAELTYNWQSAILMAADKIDARRAMREAGVKIPETILPTDPWKMSDLSGEFIARPAEHAAGSDFIHVQGSPRAADSLLRQGFYLSRIFQKDRELRVHCAHGKVLLVQDKDVGRGNLNSNTNTTAEWWVLSWEDYHMMACQEALKAMDALELDWGGVDVLVRGKDSVVLEVNTAPSVPGKIGPRKYARYFDWLLSSDKRRKHFDWSNIKEPYDFAWRQEEFE